MKAEAILYGTVARPDKQRKLSEWANSQSVSEWATDFAYQAKGKIGLELGYFENVEGWSGTFSWAAKIESLPSALKHLGDSLNSMPSREIDRLENMAVDQLETVALALDSENNLMEIISVEKGIVCEPRVQPEQVEAVHALVGKPGTWLYSTEMKRLYYVVEEGRGTIQGVVSCIY